MPEIMKLTVDPKSGAVASVLGPVVQSTSKEPEKPIVEAKTETTETVVEKTEPTKDEKVLEAQRRSEEFAAKARRERELRQRDEKGKAEVARARAEFEAERAAFAKDKAEYDEYKRLRANAKNDPDPFFKHVFGDNWYDVATEFKASGKLPEVIARSAADEKVQALKTELEAKLEALNKTQADRDNEAKKAREDAAKAQMQADLQQWAGEVIDYVKSKPTDFELINVEGQAGFNLVVQLIEANYWKTRNETGTGVTMSTQEAAERVEKWLTEQHLKRAQAKKFAGEKKPEVKTEEKKAGQVRTLSNGTVTQTISSLSRSRTDSERMKRAMDAMDAVRDGTK